MPIVPFKLNQDRRHHFPRQQCKVTNWPAYDASLRQRGSLTIWFTDEAIAGWAAEPRTTRGGQSRYSLVAILTALTLRAVFRLAYRQAEGLIGSIQPTRPLLACAGPHHASRARCTRVRSKYQGRALALLPRPEHDALAAARTREGTADGKRLYAQRNGIEGTLSEAVRGFGLRRARDRGLPKTGLQHVATAAALNLDRIAAWFAGRPLAPTRTSRFSALAA